MFMQWSSRHPTTSNVSSQSGHCHCHDGVTQVLSHTHVTISRDFGRCGRRAQRISVITNVLFRFTPDIGHRHLVSSYPSLQQSSSVVDPVTLGIVSTILLGFTKNFLSSSGGTSIWYSPYCEVDLSVCSVYGIKDFVLLSNWWNIQNYRFYTLSERSRVLCLIDGRHTSDLVS